MSKAKASGTRQETKICNLLNGHAGRRIAERVVLYGNKDHGDIRIDLGDLVLTGESKYRSKYPSESELVDFMTQTEAENYNAMQDGGVLFVNLPRKGIERMQCWMTLETVYRLRMRMVGISWPDDIPKEHLEWAKGMMRDGSDKWVMVPMHRFLDEYVGHFGGRIEEEGTNGGVRGRA